MAKNLFVGSLPYTTTEDVLSQLFSQYGTIQSLNIIKDKYTGQSRGFAFVEMATDEDAAKAIAGLNGYNLDGRNLVVKEALPKPTYGSGRSSGPRQGGRGGYGGGGGRYGR